MYLVISLAWIGVLVGSSFIAPPVKFRSAAVTSPAVRGVGLVTFKPYGKIEWLLGAILLGTGFAQITNGRINAPAIWLSIVLLCIVGFQNFWIRPGLDARVDDMMAGDELKPSVRHQIHLTLEVAKLVALLAVVAVA